MPKLYCGRADCKYNGNHYKCMAQTVKLNAWHGKTVNDGYRDFSICATYEESEDTKKFNELVAKLRGEEYGE